jgi:hypothetical protein
MRLTKHERLAKGLRALFANLDEHYRKTAISLDVVQFHFYEKKLIANRPLMSQQALRAMMYAHYHGLRHLSDKEEIRNACFKPLIGAVVNSPLFTMSNVLIDAPDNPANTRRCIPWGVITTLPSKTLKQLDDAYLEAILYCALNSEMSEWIDWFEHEDKSMSFTNQLFSIFAYEEKEAPVKRNLLKIALPFLEQAAIAFYGKLDYKKILPTIKKSDFMPNATTSIAQAYDLVSYSLRSRKNRYLDEFKRFWKSRLEELVLEDVHWSDKEKEDFFVCWASRQQPEAVKKGTIKKDTIRWKTSLVIERQSYAAFIRYFAAQFLEAPGKNQSSGEIVLLLWLMIYISLDPDQICPIKRLLQLTTANLENDILSIDGYETDLSQGLRGLLQEYIGGTTESFCRHQKLFPNLTIDYLEDAFREASTKILPKDTLPALPEAFLTFPHPHRGMRISPTQRKHYQKNPAPIYHDSISRHEIKKQLIKHSI